ncbi:hypothetical protein PQQ87_08435 [Paraburkholderia nemoris]|uniref:hypothetical protein n=1 Tax=Paraburkholderia nemoris TaxID=2793076 RepID=UPI0038B9C427
MDKLKTEAEIAQLQANTMKLQAEMMSLLVNTLKTSRENRWLPIVYAIGFLGAAAAFAKLFLH